MSNLAISLRLAWGIVGSGNYWRWRTPQLANALFRIQIMNTDRAEEEHYEQAQADVMETPSGLDKETEDMCLKYGLIPYIGKIRSRINEAYHNVTSVKLERTEDPEIEDYEKVCFEIHLSGESAQILEDEERFYAIFFKEIPEDKQEFFTFTYCIP